MGWKVKDRTTALRRSSGQFIAMLVLRNKIALQCLHSFMHEWVRVNLLCRVSIYVYIYIYYTCMYIYIYTYTLYGYTYRNFSTYTHARIYIHTPTCLDS